MPYIKKEERKVFDEFLDKILKSVCEDTSSGTLNYILTRILLEALGEKPNYQRFNDIIGILECCKLELYRRVVAKYEDQKIRENGDIVEIWI